MSFTFNLILTINTTYPCSISQLGNLLWPRQGAEERSDELQERLQQAATREDKLAILQEEFLRSRRG